MLLYSMGSCDMPTPGSPALLNDVLSVPPVCRLLVLPTPATPHSANCIITGRSTAAASAVAGYLADRLPGAILNSAGLMVMAAGLFLMATMPADVDNLGIVWRTALCGAGFGFFQSPNNRTMVLATPRARGGATGGAIATARVSGQALGAVLVALMFGLLPIGEAGRAALALAGALSVAAAAVSSLRLGHSLPHEGPRDIEAEVEAAAEG